MKQLCSIVSVTALAGALLCAPAFATFQDTNSGSEAPAPSAEGRALADQLAAVLAASGENADAATLETALINALISAGLDADIEAEALRLVRSETAVDAFRAAAIAVLARQPRDEAGFVATDEYTGGLPPGLAQLTIPNSPPTTRGGASDY